MSSQRIWACVVSLALSWVVSVNSANGQSDLRDLKERAIVYRLRQPISLNLKDVPLGQAIKDISIVSGIQIVPDSKNLEAARIKMDSPVSITVEDTDMKFALNLLLRPLRLTFVIEDQVLKITPEDRPGRLTRVTYPIGDLIAPACNHSVFKERQPQSEKEPLSPDSIAAKLVTLTTENVMKNSWQEFGGRATVQYFPLGKAIVVNQTQEAHEEIALLLASWRKLYEVQVSVELRLVTVSHKFAKQYAKDLTTQGQPVPGFLGAKGKLAPEPKRFVSIDEKRLFAFLESIQGDRSAHITQAPKLTLINGQRAGIDATMRNDDGGVRDGIRCDFLPVADPERKNVRLLLDFESVTPIANTKGILSRQVTNAVGTFVVPNGHTLVWNLGETAGRQHLFLLATQRIHVVTDEGVFLGEIKPIPGR